MTKKESTEWKSQVERAERKARIARLKGSQGEKKKIRSHSAVRKPIIIAVCAVLVIALLGWLIVGTGMIVRHVTALTVDGRKFSAGDLNLSIGNTVANAQLGLAFTDEFQKTLKTPSPFAPNQTMRDLLVDSAVSQLQYVAAAVHEMEASGFRLTDEQQEQIRKALDNYDKQMLQYSNQTGKSVTSILRTYYGPGITMKMVRKNMEENMRLSFYVDHLRNQADVSDAKLSSYYEENKDSFDLFSYLSYEFKPADATLKGDDLKKALEELEKKANAAAEELKEKSFLDAVCGQLSEDDAKKLRENASSLTRTRQKKASVLADIFDFLKDAGRKKDDVKVIRGASSVSLVQFISRDKNDFRSYSVRHILIAGEKTDDKKSETNDAELKKQAEELLASFNAGAKTEEAFAALAKEKSKDKGSAANGGLYANVTFEKNAQFVKPFREWCEDASRKAGDTGIVKTDFGYHIMYFVSRSEEVEQVSTIRETIRNEHIQNWSKEVTKGVKTERHAFGMKFVASNNPLKALFSADPSNMVPTSTQLPSAPAASGTEAAPSASGTAGPSGSDAAGTENTESMTASEATGTDAGKETPSDPDGSLPAASGNEAQPTAA